MLHRHWRVAIAGAPGQSADQAISTLPRSNRMESMSPRRDPANPIRPTDESQPCPMSKDAACSAVTIVVLEQVSVGHSQWRPVQPEAFDAAPYRHLRALINYPGTVGNHRISGCCD